MGLVEVKITVEEEDVKTLLDMIDIKKLKNSTTVTFTFNPPINVEKF